MKWKHSENEWSTWRQHITMWSCSETQKQKPTKTERLLSKMLKRGSTKSIQVIRSSKKN
jgi:hypothetical protein